MTSEGRGILSPMTLVAPWRKALQALDFQNREPPRIYRDLRPDGYSHGYSPRIEEAYPPANGVTERP